MGGRDGAEQRIDEDLPDLNTENAVVQDYLIGAYNRYIDMGVDGFRVDTAKHISRNTFNRRFIPAAKQRALENEGERGRGFFLFGEVGSFVHEVWNKGVAPLSAPFYTWQERRGYSADDTRRRRGVGLRTRPGHRQPARRATTRCCAATTTTPRTTRAPRAWR